MESKVERTQLTLGAYAQLQQSKPASAKAFSSAKGPGFKSAFNTDNRTLASVKVHEAANEVKASVTARIRLEIASRIAR